VDVTVPKNFIVGATGVQWGEQARGDAKTLRFHAEDVHDFGWTASPKFLDRTETFDGIKVRVLMQPGNAGHIDRYMEAARHTIECYAKWIWRYPYPQMTIVDPPTNGMGAAGMEYPMLIAGGTSPFLPRTLLMTEMVVVHEFGHNYWYGMEANNEFEEAWLDEGINSYYEARIMDEAYGQKTSILGGLLGWHLGDFQMQHMQYMAIPDMDPVAQEAWKYSSNGSYGVISYSKGSLVLKTLEGLLGQKKMDEVMRAFFDEVKFTHPTTEDFLRIVSRAAGRDLDPLLGPLIYGTGTVDFKVARVKNERRSEPEGYDLAKAPPKLMAVSKKDKKDKGKEKGAKGTYDSRITVQRKGELVLPVEVRVTFADKTSKLEWWDGQGRYKVWTYGGPKVTRVEVDPEGKVAVDLQRLNNGWSAEGDGGGASSVVSRFRAVIQTLFAVSIGLF
jgi:aminopeptidase N